MLKYKIMLTHCHYEKYNKFDEAIESLCHSEHQRRISFKTQSVYGDPLLAARDDIFLDCIALESSLAITLGKKIIKLLAILSIILYNLICFAEDSSPKLTKHNNAKTIIKDTLSHIAIKHKVTLYRELLENSQNFTHVINFIKNNKEWPILELKAKAEKLALTANAKEVSQWFKQFPPTTGEGFKALAVKHCMLSNQNTCNKKIIADGWIKGSFDNKEEKEYLKKYSHYLTTADHNKKITEAIWRGDFETAERLLYLVPKENVATYKLAIRLLNDEPGVILEYVKSHKTSLLNYAYLAAHKKKPLSPTIYKILQHEIRDDEHASIMAKIRFFYAREYFGEHKYREAYDIIKVNHSKTSVDISDSEWFAGWIALRYLRKPNIALQHFNRMYQVTKKPIGRAKATYWIARSYKAQKNNQEAENWFRKSAEYGYPFYSLLAQEELKFKTLKLAKMKKPYKTVPHEMAQAIKLLLADNRKDLAEIFGKHIIQNSRSENDIMSILNSTMEMKNYYLLVRFAKEANFKGLIVPEYLFPYPKHSITQCFVPLSLAYAIARHESEFDPYATAIDDGIGLMQIMPETAYDVGKSLGEKCDLTRLVRDAGYNIKFGSKHLADHLDYYKSYILAIPSYNAGRDKVDLWIEKFKDPRKMKNVYDIIDWIEGLPFGRTREYVMRVLENFTMYQLIIDNDNKLNLHNNLRTISHT